MRVSYERDCNGAGVSAKKYDRIGNQQQVAFSLAASCCKHISQAKR